MKKFNLLIILPATLQMLVSCGSDTMSERIAAAEMAFAAEDVESTRKLCDDIMSESSANGSVTATELARLSILYMQLNDRTDDQEAVKLAADCYKEAFQANADSARAYYESLPPDEVKYAMTLSSIVHAIDNPKAIEDYTDESHEYVDSI